MSFGRILEVVVFNNSGQAYVLCDENSDLEVLVSGAKYIGYQRPNFEVEIKNLSPLIIGEIASQGYSNIYVKAGYKDESFSEVFNGTILYINPSKEDGHTLNVKFLCTNGTAFVSQATISKTFNAGTNYYLIADYILKNSGISVSQELDDKLKDYVLEEDTIYNGSSYDSLNEIADANNMLFTFDDNTIKITTLQDKLEAFVLSPETGMISYPQLTTEGLKVDVLFSPLFKIGDIVKVENSSFINVQMGSSEDYLAGERPNNQFSKDGTYFIKEIKYTLNTRSGDFKVSLECLSRELYTALYGGTQ